MSSILVTVKELERFTISGVNTRTQNRDEFDEKTAKIPSLWQRFHSSNLLTKGADVFAVYSDYESDANGLYTLTVGQQTDVNTPQAVKVEAGRYLVFRNIGPMPETVIATWKHIWDYFAEHKEYQRRFVSDVEAYNGSDEIAIYIGIQA